MLEEENEFKKVNLIEQAGHIENNLLEALINKQIKDYQININHDDEQVEVMVYPLKTADSINLQGNAKRPIIPYNIYTKLVSFKNWLSNSLKNYFIYTR